MPRWSYYLIFVVLSYLVAFVLKVSITSLDYPEEAGAEVKWIFASFIIMQVILGMILINAQWNRMIRVVLLTVFIIVACMMAFYLLAGLLALGEVGLPSTLLPILYFGLTIGLWEIAIKRVKVEEAGQAT